MNKLKKLREESELSMRELADFIDVSYTTIYWLESEKRPFRQEHIAKLCAFFGVTSDYLLGRSDVGIEVSYIDFNTGKATHENLSEKEYDSLKSAGRLRETIYSSPPSFTCMTDDGRRLDYPPKYVHRSVDVSQTEIDECGRLRSRLENEIRKMDETELRKTLRFIEEFIR